LRIFDCRLPIGLLPKQVNSPQRPIANWQSEIGNAWRGARVVELAALEML
jgi:hypothetical protein